VTTEHFSSRAPNAVQHECRQAGVDFTLHGVVFAILVQALPCPAEAAQSSGFERNPALAAIRGGWRQENAIICRESVPQCRASTFPGHRRQRNLNLQSNLTGIRFNRL
jgi:hypothetical protein